jgi:hypothetical protein
MVSVPSLGRVHLVPLALAVVIVAGVGGAIALGASLSTLELAGMVLAVVVVFLQAFERTREDPRMPPTKFLLLTASFALIYASPPRSAFQAGMTALLAVGTIVEVYNYRTNSAVLRFET